MAEREAEHRIIAWGGKHPPTWRLAHNPVRPTSANQRHGVSGFRAFWVSPDDDRWVECGCGWRPDKGTHYRRK